MAVGRRIQQRPWHSAVHGRAGTGRMLGRRDEHHLTARVQGTWNLGQPDRRSSTSSSAESHGDACEPNLIPPAHHHHRGCRRGQGPLAASRWPGARMPGSSPTAGAPTSRGSLATSRARRPRTCNAAGSSSSACDCVVGPDGTPSSRGECQPVQQLTRVEVNGERDRLACSPHDFVT